MGGGKVGLTSDTEVNLWFGKKKKKGKKKKEKNPAAQWKNRIRAMHEGGRVLLVYCLTLMLV